ncbi:hypothetical protein G5B04_11645 [Fusicatenibacter saccharivorans]|nr:hypothetical protein [Fusicatenibacter saccharivorans]NSF06471.1 hypothetical protein [Fusicatenibacter saccharivorans]
MTLDKKIITQVIGFCNRDLVPDEQFKSGATPYRDCEKKSVNKILL